METDPEVKESRDHHYTLHFRQYDPRVGRWWSHDPVKQIGESPYAAMFNNPVSFADPLGSDPQGGGDGSSPLSPGSGGGGGGGGKGPLLPSPGPGPGGPMSEYTLTFEKIFKQAEEINKQRQAENLVGTGAMVMRNCQIPFSPSPPPAGVGVAVTGIPRQETLGPADVEQSEWRKTVDAVDEDVHSIPWWGWFTPYYVTGKLGAMALFDVADDATVAVSDLTSRITGDETIGPRHLNGTRADGKETKEALLNTFINIEGGILFGIIGGTANAGAGTLDEASPVVGDIFRSGMDEAVGLTDDVGRGTVLDPGAGVVDDAVKGASEYTVHPNKYDCFFGRVTKGDPHNIIRPAQNKADLAKIGITNESQLAKVFDEAVTAPIVDRHVSSYGTTIARKVYVGDAYSIKVEFFYEGGDMSLTPKITSLIPQIH